MPLSTERAILGESPAWSATEQAVWWVDITGHRVFRTTLDGRTDAFDTPEHPGFVQPVGGVVYVGMQSGLFRLDSARKRFDLIAPLRAEGVRFNDACTGANGRIWAGTMCLENARRVGVLYLFEPETGALTPKLEGFRTINGLAWDAGRNRLFLSDSNPAVQTAWTCPVSPAGALGPRAEFARFHDLEGRPDGAMIDALGAYWIAGIDGGVIYRFAPDGTLNARFAVDMAKPTKPAQVDTPGGPAIVLTSFGDDGIGGRLCLWRDPPLGAI